MIFFKKAGYNCFILWLFFPVIANAAFEIKGDANATSISWDNVSINNSDMVPSAWGTPPSLQSTNAWIPATFASPPPTTLTLTGGPSGGSTSPIAINIKGVEYNTSGISFTSDNGSNMGSGCSLEKIALPIISLQGSNCISSEKFESLVAISPFVFFRPIFYINDNDILSALNGLEKGTYTGFVPITLYYYYEESGGILSVRNINEILSISITYEPVNISEVLIVGDGVMEPVYDTTNQTVSSTADYNITVNGYFDNGLVLTMPEQNYELENTADADVVIPYNVNCAQCNNVNLVSDGFLINPITTIAENSGSKTSINFILDFDYDVGGETLISGDYNDSIIIMIEPGI